MKNINKGHVQIYSENRLHIKLKRHGTMILQRYALGGPTWWCVRKSTGEGNHHMNGIPRCFHWNLGVDVNFLHGTVESLISWQSRDSISSVAPHWSFGLLNCIEGKQHSRNRVTWLSKYERLYWILNDSRFSHIWTVMWHYFYVNVSLTEWCDEANNMGRINNYMKPFHVPFFELKILCWIGFLYYMRKNRLLPLLFELRWSSLGIMREICVLICRQAANVVAFLPSRISNYALSLLQFYPFYAFHNYLYRVLLLSHAGIWCNCGGWARANA